MKQRLRHVAPITVAKIAAILYGIMGLVFAPVFLLMSRNAAEGGGFPVGLVLVMPVLYAVGGFVFSLIGVALYNVVAGWVGGIEIDLEPQAAP